MSVREPGGAAGDLQADVYHALLAHGADFIVDRFDADVLFVAMERQDIREAHRVIGQMAFPERAYVLRGQYPPGELAGLMHPAGARFEAGREEDQLVQPMTLMFRMAGFDRGPFAAYVRQHPDEWRGALGLWDLIRGPRRQASWSCPARTSRRDRVRAASARRKDEDVRSFAEHDPHAPAQRVRQARRAQPRRRGQAGARARPAIALLAQALIRAAVSRAPRGAQSP